MLRIILRGSFSHLLFAAILVAFFSIVAQAQSSVFSTGLNGPIKIINAADDTMLVAEVGTLAPNTGRISIIDGAPGARQTLIDGLPSGINTVAPLAPEPAGPHGLYLDGLRLFLVIGPGDAVRRGAAGVELVNPSPSSPLFVSVLELTLPVGYQDITNGFSLSREQHETLAAGRSVTLQKGNGQELTIRMVVNLPNSAPNFRPDAPENVRASNPFGVELYQEELYVVDASFNLIYRVPVSVATFNFPLAFTPKAYAYSVFTRFEQIRNPLFPGFGPPFVDAVPDSIHREGNNLNVTLLTGFPFAPGVAELRAVSLTDGSQTTLVRGLRSAIDSLKAVGGYFILEFSSNQLAGAPGRLSFFPTTGFIRTRTRISSELLTPTAMVRNGEGDIFITSIATGTIVRVELP
ncbi:MAG: ScyD/ScyE family protein [Pyrinomonadaceae bacterium]